MWRQFVLLFLIAVQAWHARASTSVIPPNSPYEIEVLWVLQGRGFSFTGFFLGNDSYWLMFFSLV